MAPPRHQICMPMRRLHAVCVHGFAFICGVAFTAELPAMARPVAATVPAARLLSTHPYALHVTEASQRFGIPEHWIWAVMRAESDGQSRAVSHAGAIGLMQIMPRTWAMLSARFHLGPEPIRLEAYRRSANMLRTAFGSAIGQWLDDPEVIEIMLNPDGRLWVDRLGQGISASPHVLNSADGERIIRLVAHHVGAEVHGRMPRVSAELPGGGERFEGLLPPVVAAPAFAIRKPATAVFTLSDYVAAGIMSAKLAAGAAGSAIVGAASGSARAAGGASGAYSAGAAGRSGRAAVASGFANVAKTAAGAATSPLRRAAYSLKASYTAGKKGAPQGGDATGSPDGPPAWATALRRPQTIGQGASITAHTLKGGDSHSGGQGPDITDKS